VLFAPGGSQRFLSKLTANSQRFLSEVTGLNTEKPQLKPQLEPETVATEFAFGLQMPSFRSPVITAFAFVEPNQCRPA
jgi:hypothetical protein